MHDRFKRERERIYTYLSEDRMIFSGIISVQLD